jgi:hypothetical protein
MPASASFKTVIICSSLNLLPRIVHLLLLEFYHAPTPITTGTVFGGEVNAISIIAG